MPLIGLLLLLLLALVAGALAGLHGLDIEATIARRIALIGGRDPASLEGEGHLPWQVRVLARIGLFIARSGLLSPKTIADLRQTLRMAGLRERSAFAVFVGAKVVALGAGLAAGLGLGLALGRGGALAMIAAAIGAVCGLLLPDTLVRMRRNRFVSRIEIGLADSLDMMVICADAGLGLESALARVAEDLGETHAEISEELTITATEMRIGNSTRDALYALGARTDLDSLKRLGATLIQTIQYGTPLTQALRSLAAELREEQLTRFEERAARLPVLLTVPMIIFILPCVFLIVGGPAAVNVAHMMTGH